MTKYIYSLPMCSACVALKEKHKKEGVKFVERDGTRLTDPNKDWDEIDEEGRVQLAIQNDTFPVEIDI
jgi:hypothetical protein